MPINVVLVSVLGGVGEGPDLHLSLGDPAHAVILDGDPVHQGPEDLILDLLDAAVLVKVLGVCHHCRRDDLRQKGRKSQQSARSDSTLILSYLIDVIVDDSKLPKLLHLPGYVIKLVKVDGKGRLVDHGLHASDSEAVVVGVVEARVHHSVLAEAEYLPVHQWADLTISDGADEALALQVDRLQHTRHLVVGEADPCRVVKDLRELVLVKTHVDC